MKLIFATNNPHKVAEIQAALSNPLEVVSLREAGIAIDIPEPHPTLEANAVEKATVVHQLTGENCFSEDSGLEVTALAGAPGVRSARFAGDGATTPQNIEKLMGLLKSCTDRSAQFRTVICLILNGEHHLFEGRCSGRIAVEPSGSGGFGYDPVFVPDGGSRTFAQMSLHEKARLSHRRKAMDKLVEFLKRTPINY